MNRIERLIWEETQIATIARMQRDARRTSRAKFVSIAFLVGVVALLASRVSIPPLGETLVQALAPASIVYTPATAPKPARGAESRAAAPAHDANDATASPRRQDDPPKATF